MTTLILVLHVIVSLALILIVLLQTGKGAEMGATFGGSNQTVFGSQGATTFLGKITTAAAILFMLTSLTLAYLSSRKTTTVMRDSSAPAEAPAVPAGQPQEAEQVPALPAESELPVSEEAVPADEPVGIPPAPPAD